MFACPPTITTAGHCIPTQWVSSSNCSFPLKRRPLGRGLSSVSMYLLACPDKLYLVGVGVGGNKAYQLLRPSSPHPPNKGCQDKL